MIRSVFLVMAFGLAGGAGAVEDVRTLRLDHGLVLALPDGWEAEDGEETEDGTWDATDLSRVRLTCTAQACAKTRESCYLKLHQNPVEGPDETERLQTLYASPVDRYARLRRVLRIAGDGSAIVRPLAAVGIGRRTWWVVETASPGEDRSGLFAETVIDERRLEATCRSREAGATAHNAARALLSTLRGPVGAPARGDPQSRD